MDRVQYVPRRRWLHGCKPLLLDRVRDGGAAAPAYRGTRQAPYGALWYSNVISVRSYEIFETMNIDSGLRIKKVQFRPEFF